MEAGNNRQLALILKQYKDKSGEVNFPAVFSVPTDQRLPAIIASDFMKATALVVAALSLAFEKLNFKKKTEFGKLINDIADEIIDTADEDNISMEDLLLFLQGMVRGKYGEITEMSVARFMKLFEGYRQIRHESILLLRENEHLQYKGLGDAERTSKSDELEQRFANFGDRIAELKESIRNERNPHLKDIDKF